MPTRQRDAFNAILAVSGGAVSGEDVQGYALFTTEWIFVTTILVLGIIPGLRR